MIGTDDTTLELYYARQENSGGNLGHWNWAPVLFGTVDHLGAGGLGMVYRKTWYIDTSVPSSWNYSLYKAFAVGILNIFGELRIGVHEIYLNATGVMPQDTRFDWEFLGTIGPDPDIQKNQKTLSFPENVTSKRIGLKFEFLGTEFTLPAMHRYEVEYLPLQNDAETADMVVTAADGVQLRDITAVENSGRWIATSIHSMGGSAIPHVVALPWPEVHTIRALITISEPGIVVPFLKTRDFPGTEIPIHIEEV
jgi:hypothetical protein